MTISESNECMKRIILIKGSTETLEYFSLQLAMSFSDMGYEIFIWDMTHPLGSREAFEELDNPGESVLITFNFKGLCGEGQFAAGLSNIWDEYGIEKLCIMVDSPAYYYRQLSGGIENLKVVCIDKYHMKYVAEHYPEYGECYFVPLAGNVPVCDLWLKEGILSSSSLSYFNYRNEMLRSDNEDCIKGWRDRRIDALFIGNYITTDSLEPSLKGLGPDYREFVMDIANELIDNPCKPFEETLLRRLTNEFPESSDEEYKMAMYQMIYIDLYVRSIYRGRIVAALADAGVKIYCTGKDWDKAECRHPENLIHTGDIVTSLKCLQALSQAKVSLNVMPWFKAGAHDRIFSSMLSGCALVSDSSEYLNEVITDGEHYCEFKLGSPDEAALQATEKTIWLLSHEAQAEEIAHNGYRLASKAHTWADRAQELESIMLGK